MITNSGAGTDILDIDWFTKHGVYVSNTPNAVTKATADGTALMILSAIKNTTEVMAQAKSSRPWREGLGLMGDPEDMTLGIIGMGKIGQQIAQRLSAFGMKTVYHNRTRLSDTQEKDLHVSYVSMNELLEVSDVISVMCPLTPSTRHILNKETLAKAKDGVIVVNTSRGGCVDTVALIEALKTGKVSQCAVDVFETEPEIPQYFKDSNKVMVMPHYLAFTRGTMRRVELELLENIATFQAHGMPKNTARYIRIEVKKSAKSYLQIMSRLLRSINLFASPALRSRGAFPTVLSQSRQLTDTTRSAIESAIATSPVVLFMKGTPEQPMCGFSRATIQILGLQGVDPKKLSAFNVLEDSDLREGVKEFSEWPTIPQLYVNKEFVGGCDILVGMHQSGELEDLLEKAGVLQPPINENASQETSTK
ncbi:protein of unknown function [Taphrina deformans PYCC 5710]|uniref:Monothiol glutaredoxin-5, mitochondrial n=1 Tax=Taphrina deformans (strain PYCC 5710 / ATCC 11124 / CBS 356.35 / IMI 108563 / JCM 9778 / NBRC 8474) TaxID=1097556 RepID=R4XGD2_TAPDE|nr:protein of unknown function [Taphrina deformans PYCC 5710]|eukprot:CCG84820.1 protein of unknown function [Taphrina deformans PYCC 5710]